MFYSGIMADTGRFYSGIMADIGRFYSGIWLIKAGSQNCETLLLAFVMSVRM